MTAAPLSQAEHIFDLCAVVSPLRFFRQFDASTTAALCARLVLEPLAQGTVLELEEEAVSNPLLVLLRGELQHGGKPRPGGGAAWVLRCGDSVGYRADRRWIKHRRVVATTDSLVARVEARDAHALLGARDGVCWAPELARELLCGAGARSAEAVDVVKGLLRTCPFFAALPADAFQATARFLRLETLRADEALAVDADGLVVVLSGQVRVEPSAPQQAAVPPRALDAAKTLVAGEAFPQHALDAATTRERLARRAPASKRPGSAVAAREGPKVAGDAFGCVGFKCVAEAHAELLVLGLAALLDFMYPAPDLTYSRELVRQTLLQDPTRRSAADVRALSVTLLRAAPFFATLPQLACDRLAARLELVTLARGERQQVSGSGDGEPMRRCVVVVSGGCRVGTLRLSPGDVFGARSFLEARQTSRHPHATSMRDVFGDGGDEDDALWAECDGDGCELAYLDECFYRTCEQGRPAPLVAARAGDAAAIAAAYALVDPTADPFHGSRLRRLASSRRAVAGPPPSPRAGAAVDWAAAASRSATSRSPLACLPLALRRRLAALATVRRLAAGAEARGERVGGVVARGSLSVHLHATPEAARAHRGRGARDAPKAQRPGLPFATEDDVEGAAARTRWRRMQLGECAAVLLDGALLPAGGEARLITREATVLVGVDPEEWYRAIAAAAARPPSPEGPMVPAPGRRGDAPRPLATEVVLRLVARDDELGGLPPRLRLRVARGAEMRRLRSGDRDGLRRLARTARCFLVEGTVEVRRKRGAYALADQRLVHRNAFLTDAAVVGHLVAGDAFGTSAWVAAGPEADIDDSSLDDSFYDGDSLDVARAPGWDADADDDVAYRPSSDLVLVAVTIEARCRAVEAEAARDDAPSPEAERASAVTPRTARTKPPRGAEDGADDSPDWRGTATPQPSGFGSVEPSGFGSLAAAALSPVADDDSDGRSLATLEDPRLVVHLAGRPWVEKSLSLPAGTSLDPVPSMWRIGTSAGQAGGLAEFSFRGGARGAIANFDMQHSRSPRSPRTAANGMARELRDAAAAPRYAQTQPRYAQLPRRGGKQRHAPRPPAPLQQQSSQLSPRYPPPLSVSVVARGGSTAPLWQARRQPPMQQPPPRQLPQQQHQQPPRPPQQPLRPAAVSSKQQPIRPLLRSPGVQLDPTSPFAGFSRAL
ncbi:hypothetical protein M885DRAFT_612165 [Pelagophyceae sp. CCMP2097]|nr:hypothetical protein M885DRAFT_612165 [Pelagophyceae sp. CCMP2097]